jgi:hypothetical protein
MKVMFEKERKRQASTIARFAILAAILLTFIIVVAPKVLSQGMTALAARVTPVVTLTPAKLQSPALTNLSLASSSVVGGNTVTGTVTLSSPAGYPPAFISLSSNSTSATVSPNVVVPPGQTSANFTVTTYAVTSTQSTIITATYAGVSKTATLQVTSSGGGGGSCIPAPSTASVQSLSVTPNTLMGGTGRVFGKVTLTAPAALGGQAINLSNLSAGAVSASVKMPSYIVVPEGQTIAYFPIEGGVVTSNQVVTLGAGFHNEVPQTTILTLLPKTGSIVLDDGPESGTPSTGLSVAPLGNTQQGSTELQALVQSIMGPGVQVVNPGNIRFTGSSIAGGGFSGGRGIIGFDSGIVLGSGAIANVIGPNNSDNITSSLGMPGDSWLTYLAFGIPTQDATVLEFDIIPSSNVLKFNYVFSSDEYNEYANTTFNDVFAFFVDGVNVGLIPGTDIPVSVNTVNNGNPYGDTHPHHAELYVDNQRTINPLNTQMDGLTTVLTAKTYVTPGKVTRIRLAIADAGDSLYDSHVFLRAGSLTSVNGLLPTSVSTQSKLIYQINDTTDPYTAPAILCPNLSGDSNRPAFFDFTGLQGGLISGAHLLRQGSVAYNVASYDNEWGVRSGLTPSLTSYGGYARMEYFTSYGTLPLEGDTSPKNYRYAWFLPFDFLPDLQSGGGGGSTGGGGLGGGAPSLLSFPSAPSTIYVRSAPGLPVQGTVPTQGILSAPIGTGGVGTIGGGGVSVNLPANYKMMLTDRTLSPLASWSLTDTPQAWYAGGSSTASNVLSILVQPNGNPRVEQGKSITMTIPGSTGQPDVNTWLGLWEIRRGSTVYATSDTPNGWSVTGDWSPYEGVIISAPAGLLTKRNLEVRFRARAQVIGFNGVGFRTIVWNGTGRFDLIGTDGDGVNTDNAPLAPTNLIATPVSQTQINLTWGDPNQDETGVYVERKQGVGGTWQQVAELGANATSYSDTGLTKKTLYIYRVRAYNDVGPSAYSNEASATTFDDPPAGAPTNLVATAVSKSQINLSWTDNSNNETGFKIERKQGTSGWSQIATVGGNATTYQNTGLTPNTNYTYRVYAYNSGGSSDYSNEASATTFSLNPPAAPTNLVAVAISDGQINLSWIDNSNNETGFKIQRRTVVNGVPGGWDFAVTTVANATTFTNTSLLPSTTYEYRVCSTNDDGDSAWSNIATATTQAAQPPNGIPSGLTAVAVSYTQINLAWTDTSTNETGFELQRKLTNGGSWVTISSNIGANTTSYSNTGLTPNTSYTYHIRAINGSGSSGWSNEATAKTFANLAVGADDFYLSAYATGASSIRIYWDRLSDVSKYQIFRSTTAGVYSSSQLIAEVAPNISKYDDYGLQSGTEYFYIIRAIKTSNVEYISEEDSAIPHNGAIPWNGTAAAILSAARQQVPTVTDSDGNILPLYPGTLQVMGPDGKIYDEEGMSEKPRNVMPNKNIAIVDGWEMQLPLQNEDDDGGLLGINSINDIMQPRWRHSSFSLCTLYKQDAGHGAVRRVRSKYKLGNTATSSLISGISTEFYLPKTNGIDNFINIANESKKNLSGMTPAEIDSISEYNTSIHIYLGIHAPESKIAGHERRGVEIDSGIFYMMPKQLSNGTNLPARWNSFIRVTEGPKGNSAGVPIDTIRNRTAGSAKKDKYIYAQSSIGNQVNEFFSVNRTNKTAYSQVIATDAYGVYYVTGTLVASKVDKLPGYTINLEDIDKINFKRQVSMDQGQGYSGTVSNFTDQKAFSGCIKDGSFIKDIDIKNTFLHIDSYPGVPTPFYQEYVAGDDLTGNSGNYYWPKYQLGGGSPITFAPPGHSAYKEKISIIL